MSGRQCDADIARIFHVLLLFNFSCNRTRVVTCGSVCPIGTDVAIEAVISRKKKEDNQQVDKKKESLRQENEKKETAGAPNGSRVT